MRIALGSPVSWHMVHTSSDGEIMRLMSNIWNERVAISASWWNWTSGSEAFPSPIDSMLCGVAKLGSSSGPDTHYDYGTLLAGCPDNLKASARRSFGLASPRFDHSCVGFFDSSMFSVVLDVSISSPSALRDADFISPPAALATSATFSPIDWSSGISPCRSASDRAAE